MALNSLNRSMGLPDVYPFVLAERVIAKLRFVHQVVERAGHGRAAAIAPDVERAADNRAQDAAEVASAEAMNTSAPLESSVEFDGTKPPSHPGASGAAELVAPPEMVSPATTGPTQLATPA